MAIDDTGNDPLLDILKTLGALDVDETRADRIRDRCRNRLRTRRRVQNIAAVPVVAVAQRFIEFGLVTALCGVYLEEVLRRALGLLG